jgi:hypothetical protein
MNPLHVLTSRLMKLWIAHPVSREMEDWQFGTARKAEEGKMWRKSRYFPRPGVQGGVPVIGIPAQKDNQTLLLGLAGTLVRLHY